MASFKEGHGAYIIRFELISCFLPCDIYIYIKINKFTRHVTTSDLPIPEAGDIKARKRYIYIYIHIYIYLVNCDNRYTF